jgi:hypothetical protein
MAAFGDIQQDEQAVAASNAPADATPEIDINDPRLVSENIEIDPAGDAYAMPPVLPDGKWRAKLVAKEVGKAPNQKKFAPKLDRDQRPYLYTALEADVIDHSGKFDGIKVPDYFVSTQVRRDGSSAAATILARLGKPANRTTTHGALMNDLLSALAGEPELTIETEWESACQKCEEAATARNERKPRSTRGMHNFPQQKTASGKMEYVPRMKCQVNPQHGEMFARPRITHYHSLDAK